MENTEKKFDTPYKIVRKSDGEVMVDVAWTSDSANGGEEGDFLEFGLVDGTKVRFNRPEHSNSEGTRFENDEYTAEFEPKDEVVADQNVANTENQETI